MAYFIEDVLDLPTVEALTEALADEALYEDGAKTAAGSARAVKSNLQARPSEGVVRRAKQMVERALDANADFQAAALPARLSRLAFSRYTPGMRYGPHVDDAFIAGVRTDLSFTLFLSDPDGYEGGELVVQRHDGDEAVKLPPGSLYLYPSHSLHHVAPVERGVRLAAVGWVQSRVRAEEQRAVLFDLLRVLRQLPQSDESRETRLTLLRARNSLLRLWAD
ncbi:MAG: Fe2+-dependent dioxygenase [Myxococcota bacterium]